MNKRLFWVLTAFISFSIGILAVFIWLNSDHPKGVHTERSTVKVMKCVEPKNYPGLSLEIGKLTQKNGHFFPGPSNDPGFREKVAVTVRNGWYGEHLKAAGENSLLNISDKDLEVYRFTWLRTFNHPVIVRIEKRKDKIKVFFKELSGAGGYEPGKIFAENSIFLDGEDWCDLIGSLNDADFWKLSSSDEERRGTDGAQWIIEGVKDNRYHVVDRWSPTKSAYREVGLHFLRLSGFVSDKEENRIY